MTSPGPAAINRLVKRARERWRNDQPGGENEAAAQDCVALR
jgi:hypothetical protein